MKLNKKKICFDIDNVICETHNSDYKNSKPIYAAINKINKLFKKNTIILFTARYMGRTNGSRIKSKKIGYNLTKKQLKKWGVKYHQLIMGKPSYDLIVDDLAIYFKKTWYKEIDKYL